MDLLTRETNQENLSEVIIPVLVHAKLHFGNGRDSILVQFIKKRSVKFSVSKEESTNFSIIHFNCRSLPSSYNKLKDSINALDVQFDVIALSETWLIDNDSDSFNIDGYKMFTCSRTNKSGGGVALYINDSLQHKYLPDMSKCLDNCAEVVSLEIALKNGKKL